ncbi:hypothetical protein KC345_g852 [Hortaea werneckii]|nr:hypothetical protein KC345_g852 [Hortaea werneckii]
MAAATVAPPELTRFIGNCCPDHGCRTSSRLRTTVVVVVVVVFFFFYGTSRPATFFFAADFASWASDIFFGTPDWPSVKLRAASILLTPASTVVVFFGAAHRTSYVLQSTASLHATDILFKLYPAPWRPFHVSVTNLLHSTTVIWAVYSLVVHWTSNLSSAPFLHPINLFILRWTANFSTASTLYRIHFFIPHWSAHAPSIYHLHPTASTLYRINFFISHWAAHSPSSANGAAFLINCASDRAPFVNVSSWIMPSIFLPYRPADYCDNCHLQYDWVLKPVWILYILATAVRDTPTNHSHRNTVLPFANKHLCSSRRSDLPGRPTNYRHRNTVLPFANKHLSYSRRSNLPKRPNRDGDRPCSPIADGDEVNFEYFEFGIVNGTTPTTNNQCYQFSKAVSSVIYFLSGPTLPANCRIEFYETFDCTDRVIRELGLVKNADTCSSPGGLTRSLKVTCGGGPGSHY